MRDQKVLPDDQTSYLLACLVQIVHLPNLEEITVAMLLSDEWTHYRRDLKEAHSWKEVLPRMAIIAETYPKLKVIKLCIRIMLRSEGERIINWDVWVSR
jgi:hypothetical protein